MPGELIVSLHAVFGGSLCACTVSSGTQSGHAQCLVVHRLCVCVCACSVWWVHRLCVHAQCLVVHRLYVCACTRTVSGGALYVQSVWYYNVCSVR